MTDSGKKQPFLPRNPSPLKQNKSQVILKIAAGFIGVLALLFILIISVDLNTFREPVTEALSRATGLKIKLEFLDWGFSDGLKIKCKGVQIFSGETEEELVSTKELLISLSWLPLLEKRVVINSLTLVGPVLKISIKTPPRNGTLPLSEKSSSDILPNPSPLMGKKPSPPNWLHNVREFLKKPNLTLDEINLIAGQIVFQDKGAGKEALLNAEARMQINREGSRVGLVLDKIELAMGNLMVQGQIRSDDFISPSSPMRASIQIKPFKVSDLLPILQWTPESQNAINEKLKLKGDFHELNLKLISSIGSTADFNSIIKSVEAELILKGKAISLVQYGKTISFSTIEAAIQKIDQQWGHKISLGILGGNFKAEGKMLHGKGAESALDWTLNSNLIIEKFHLNELKNTFFHQVASFPKTGTLSAKVHIQGSVLRPSSLRAEGSVSTQNLSFPLQGSHVSIVGMEGSGRWFGDRLSHQFRMTAFGGEISMKGNLRFKKNNQGKLDPVIDSEVTPQSIQLSSLRPLIQKDWFPEKGTLTGKVHVQGPVLHPQLIKAEGKMGVIDTAIRHRGTSVPIAAINGTGRWIKNRLAHDLKMKVFGGNVQIKGNLKLNKTRQGELDPIIDSDVIPKSIQLSSLRPLVQKNWFPEKGVLTGSIHLQGPVKRFSETILIGKLTGRKVFLEIAEKPVVLEKAVLSFEPNAQKNRLIGFNLSDISVGELRLKKSTGKVVFSKRTFELKQGKIWSKTGALLLNGAYEFKTKDYKLDISGKGLRLEDFKKEYLEGPLSLKGSLYGRVSSEGFKKGLSGNFEINSKNGRLLKAGGILTKILNTLNLKLLQGVEKGLPVDFLGGNGTIKNGILSTKNFKMVSPSLKLWVTGKADLSEEKVDAEVIAIPLQRTGKLFNKLSELVAKTQPNNGSNGLLKKTIDKIPIIGDSLAGKENEEGLLEGVFKMIPFLGEKRKEGDQPKGLIKVYFSIGGTFEKPNVYFLPEKTFMFK